MDAVAEGFSLEATDEIVYVIDERHGERDVVFLDQFGEKSSCDRDRIRRKQPRMENSIGSRIGSGVQPVLFVVDSDRLLIEATRSGLSPPCDCKPAL